MALQQEREGAGARRAVQAAMTDLRSRAAVRTPASSCAQLYTAVLPEEVRLKVLRRVVVVGQAAEQVPLQHTRTAQQHGWARVQL